MKNMHGIPCVTRHGPLPHGSPSVDLVQCERDAEGDPRPTVFTPWRCYPRPPLHSRFSFNYTLRCLMTKGGAPYTNNPAIHAGDKPGGVCCSLRYSISMNARWNGVGVVCLAQISLTILISAIILVFQYVNRSSHPLTRLIKERWFFKDDNGPFLGNASDPLAVAVSIPMGYECAPLGFVCAYVLFNILLFFGAMALLATAPHAPDLLLVSAIVSMGTVFLLSTCALMVVISRFNTRTYRWIKRATTKKHQPRKPNFDLTDEGGVFGGGALSKRTASEDGGEERDVV